MKITDLTNYPAPALTDVLAIVDVVNDTTKKVQIQNLLPTNTVGNSMLKTADGELGGAYDDWAVTLTNATIGTNGAVTGKFNKVGKTVFFEFKFAYSTTGTPSTISGLFGFSLPIQASTNYSDGDVINAVVQFYDASGSAFYYGKGHLANTRNRLDLYVDNAGSTYLGRSATSGTVPVTFTNLDTILVSGHYESA